MQLAYQEGPKWHLYLFSAIILHAKCQSALEYFYKCPLSLKLRGQGIVTLPIVVDDNSFFGVYMTKDPHHAFLSQYNQSTFQQVLGLIQMIASKWVVDNIWFVGTTFCSHKVSNRRLMWFTMVGWKIKKRERLWNC